MKNLKTKPAINGSGPKPPVLPPERTIPAAIELPRRSEAPPEWITLRSRRGCMAQVRTAAIAAYWIDRGKLEGDYYVQVGGKTFHPTEESYLEIAGWLGGTSDV